MKEGNGERMERNAEERTRECLAGRTASAQESTRNALGMNRAGMGKVRESTEGEAQENLVVTYKLTPAETDRERTENAEGNTLGSRGGTHSTVCRPSQLCVDQSRLGVGQSGTLDNAGYRG